MTLWVNIYRNVLPDMQEDAAVKLSAILHRTVRPLVHFALSVSRTNCFNSETMLANSSANGA